MKQMESEKQTKNEKQTKGEKRMEDEKQPLKGYHILIKGSHSMGLEKLADIL